MAEMMRHTGILNNTGKNVVVVFMSLPDDPESALVIDTDALPDQFNESLRKIVESIDGQDSKNLADILARRMSPDGSNITLLEKFHRSNRLQKVPVANVTMVPRRGVNWPLKDILAAMLQEEENTPADLSDLDPETRSQVISELGKFNVHAANLEGTTVSGTKAEAVSLLRMAELLEADANVKRQQAYKMDPSLLKKAKVTEKPKVTTKAQAKATTRAKAEQANRKITNINVSDTLTPDEALNLIDAVKDWPIEQTKKSTRTTKAKI
jgi:hypothetical protein